MFWIVLFFLRVFTNLENFVSTNDIQCLIIFLSESAHLYILRPSFWTLKIFVNRIYFTEVTWICKPKTVRCRDLNTAVYPIYWGNRHKRNNGLDKCRNGDFVITNIIYLSVEAANANKCKFMKTKIFLQNVLACLQYGPPDPDGK